MTQQYWSVGLQCSALLHHHNLTVLLLHLQNKPPLNKITTQLVGCAKILKENTYYAVCFHWKEFVHIFILITTELMKASLQYNIFFTQKADPEQMESWSDLVRGGLSVILDYTFVLIGPLVFRRETKQVCRQRTRSSQLVQNQIYNTNAQLLCIIK